MMSDAMLDYGEPAEGVEFERERKDQSERRRVEETDAEMQEWTDRYEGEKMGDEFEQQKERKMEEIQQRARNGQTGPKFYPLPREEGVSAGANRGVTSQEIDEVDLQGPEEEAIQPETPSPIGAGQDIRYSVLHLAGSPVTQCSTSRLFAYLTHYGAQPLGLEWVNDSSCNVVFSDAASARIAIEYLCPAVSTSYAPLIPLPNEQTLGEAVAKKKALDEPDSIMETAENASSSNNMNEWDSTFVESLLFPRKAHRIPAKLYNAPERDAAAELQQDQQSMIPGQSSSLPEDVPEIYREMEAEDRQKKLMKPKQINLQKLRGNLYLRWALESLDVKPSRAAKQSKWYREHGNDAGKEVVTKILDVGRNDERLELFPSGNSSGLPNRPQTGSSRELDGNRGRGGRKAAMDDLDADLDSWRDGREGEGGAPGYEDSRYREEYPRRSDQGRGGDRRRGGRRDHRGRPTLDSLDEELEQSRRDRSASPARLRNGPNNNGGGGGGAARVKGRGRMKAPSAWDDVDGGGASDLSYGTQRRRGGGGHQANNNSNATLEQRLSQSLEQRINGNGGGRNLLDRMR